MAVKSWAFKDAQELVGAMREKVRTFGYEITMGGSVLITGTSNNDLDLFMLPSGSGTPLPVDLLMWLASKLGPGKTIVPAQAAFAGPQPRGVVPVAPPKETFIHKMRFDLAGRKIDVFVV